MMKLITHKTRKQLADIFIVDKAYYSQLLVFKWFILDKNVSTASVVAKTLSHWIQKPMCYRHMGWNSAYSVFLLINPKLCLYVKR